MKLKYLLLSLVIGMIIFQSCKGKDTPVDEFDHAAQAILDDQKINEFLDTHFYTPPTGNENFGVIDTILNGETPLKNIVQTKEVELENINYKLYYVVDTPEGIGENPSKVDKVFVKYKGVTLNDEFTTFEEVSVNYIWLTLPNTIAGWKYGFPNYKDGGAVISGLDEPIQFEQPGKGVLFIPSGLGYRNIGTATIPANTSLIFHIELGDVERNDIDFDGIYSIYEDLNGDGDFSNDNTDEDSKPNYLDNDDDNDGLKTKYESADPNEDHNPNDALDTDNDGVPNYLDNDDDGDGIITALEEADPNGDGNPDDAIDSDGDQIPDYLDPTN